MVPEFGAEFHIIVKMVIKAPLGIQNPPPFVIPASPLCQDPMTTFLINQFLMLLIQIQLIVYIAYV